MQMYNNTTYVIHETCMAVRLVEKDHQLCIDRKHVDKQIRVRCMRLEANVAFYCDTQLLLGDISLFPSSD